ncbi:uncharacterized protein H6S33_001609 [Morchella sextelata]|uniref:uncharacterized protein n=1 Tax=Morchella sextelata TaxID=1174677 RepID=UPI001D03BD86|nr:uncharacterized protein H6S33_001609 [Morchella sextelata]KAH0608475.1 hypothetical protein H6S33_001609 [Morchella sextelata]
MAQFIKGQDPKKKITFSLDSPNTTVGWPEVSSANQDTILDLLCSLLEPIGQHRNLYIQPSKGKHSRKRKREFLSNASAASVSSIPPPSPPELNSFLTIGLNSTTRHLESMAKALPTETTAPRPRLAVFVCRSDSQPSQLHSHLPLLCGIVSKASPGLPIRLVQLPKGAQARLETSLAIPQAGFLGLMEGAPGSTVLLQFLDENVPAIKIPWLEGFPGYQTTMIKAMTTTAPQSKKGQKEYAVKKVVRVDRSDKPGI